MINDTTVSAGKSALLAHVSADQADASKIASALGKQGVNCTLLNVETNFDIHAIEGQDSAVVLLTANSLDEQSFARFVRLVDSSNVAWYPVRLGQVDIAGHLKFYLQIKQWLDIDIEENIQTERLALAILQDRPVAASSIITAPKRLGILPWLAVAVVLTLALAVVAIFWVNVGKLERRIANEPSAPKNDAPLNSAVYVSVQDDGQYPWFNPPGGVLSVSMYLPDLQNGGVKISYYRPNDDGSFAFLGDGAGVPKAENGYQSIEIDIAEANDAGVLCLIYERNLSGALPKKYILIRSVGEAQLEEPDLVNRELADGEDCNAALGKPVTEDAMVGLERREALLFAYKQRAIPMVNGIKPENGGLRLVVSYLSGRYPTPDMPTSLYLLGGESKNNLQLLMRMEKSDGYPVYKGTPPQHILVCVNSRIDSWNFASLMQGTQQSGLIYQMGPQKMIYDRDLNPCNKLVSDEAQFTQVQTWPRGKTLVPPNTGGTFAKAGGESGAVSSEPTLAGLKLGMPFDEAVEKAIKDFSGFERTDGRGKEMLDDISLYLVEQYLPMVTPDLAFSDAVFTMLRWRTNGTRLIIARAENSESVGAVLVLISPNLTLLENRNPFVGSKRFIEELTRSLGEPKVSNYEGVYYEDDREDLTMVWSAQKNGACSVKEPEIDYKGSRGRLNTEKTYNCPYNLEARYGRNGYNAVVALKLIKSEKQ